MVQTLVVTIKSGIILEFLHIENEIVPKLALENTISNLGSKTIK